MEDPVKPKDKINIIEDTCAPEYYADLKRANVDILTGMESFPQPNVLLEKIESQSTACTA